MTANELLAQLQAKGVDVSASGDDRLVIDAPKGTITEELRTSLATHKAELLQILKQPKTLESPAPPVLAPEPKKAAPAPIASAPIPEAVRPSREDTAMAASVADEISHLQAEVTRMRTEEAARRAEVEAERLAAEESLRREQEKWQQHEEELARRRAEHERQRIEAEARERAEEEKRREIADDEIDRAQQHLARMRSVEELRRRQVDEKFRAAKAAHDGELGKLRQAEEEQARRRAEQERRYLETEATKRAQEDELRRRAEMRFRTIEEEIERVQDREQARLRAAHQAQRLVDEAEQRRADEDARRKAEEQARLRVEEEARLRSEIEAQLRAEAAEKRRAEEQARLHAEEDARRRAEEQAQQLAAERARRLAEEEAQRRAEEDACRRAEEAARIKAEEDAKRQAEEHARLRSEQEVQERAAAALRDRAELEARIRAEIESKIRAEEEERLRAEADARRHVEQERLPSQPTSPPAGKPFALDLQPSDGEQMYENEPNANAHTTEIAEWFDVGLDDRKEIVPLEPEEPEIVDDSEDDVFIPLPVESESEFRAVSVPDEPAVSAQDISAQIAKQLSSSKPAERAAAVMDVGTVGGEEGFRCISAAFDDQAAEVRNAAARALYELQDDRAAAFTRALREATPERRRKIGSAIATSGLANESIRNLTGESRDKTYDAFSLLFLMSKAGEVQPLMRAIEEHPNIEVRLAVVKLLALSGQPDILPAFRRMAVRGSLPPEVRSAVMEAIYQISSQSPAEAPSLQ